MLSIDSCGKLSEQKLSFFLNSSSSAKSIEKPLTEELSEAISWSKIFTICQWVYSRLLYSEFGLWFLGLF